MSMLCLLDVDGEVTVLTLWKHAHGFARRKAYVSWHGSASA